MSDGSPKKPCPICGQPPEPRFKPFCSDRCRMRDLAHWVGGDEPYVIPGPSMVPEGVELGEEERALLEEVMAESGVGPDPDAGSDTGNVIHADFRARKRLDGGSDDG